ncbi:nucleoporin GLE1-like [Notechis scutatus]|uniref:Nucleoporin GLE1-like n=1 Tax=Notechis scutatus TaxID=8663 RepID=A0A6J1VEG0_9SAUR|nr:nucleoporin GLE1-like [Notechis scutatus]
MAEKQNTTSNVNIQTSLLALQESMAKLQEMMVKNHSETRADINELKEEMGKLKTEMRSDLSKLDQKVGSIQHALERNKHTIKEVEKRTEQTEKKLETVDQQIKTVSKEMEDSLIYIEMDKAASYLRFQNILETKDEDLELAMAEILAKALDRDKEKMLKEMDDVYRVSTSYARRNKLPKEVHIRFTRRKVRDIIYKISREEAIVYKGKEIQILKQIPRRVREQKRDYKFLATQLNKRDILFHWLIPEGMLVSWEEKKIKIDTLEKAQELYKQLAGLEDQSSKEDLDSNSQEEQDQSKNKEEKQEVRKTNQQQQEREDLKSMNIT